LDTVYSIQANQRCT